MLINVHYRVIFTTVSGSMLGRNAELASTKFWVASGIQN